MKRLAMLVLLSSLPSLAANVEANVDPGVTSCGVFLDAAPKVTIAVTAPVPPATQAKCRFDVQGVSTGAHNVRMTAIRDDPIWGLLESAQSPPFAFAKPSAPSVPASPALVP